MTTSVTEAEEIVTQKPMNRTIHQACPASFQSNPLSIATIATMTTQPIAATNTINTNAMTTPTQSVQPYWKSVKLCIARPDGSAEIHHQDGRVEKIRPDGWRERDQVRNTASVTGRTTFVTPTQYKEVTTMND
jgi:hypothetical protein